MSEEEITQLSNNVTKLCQSIDPSFTKGPETDKLCEYARKTRTLLESLAMAVGSSNPNHREAVRNEAIRHLEGNRQFEPILNGGIIGFLS